ncbi:hypothetical protein [Streptomyces sp. NPDC002564]|uniref:hypothetical protein n=1 Tax=Streptomyces sp. NPDC002564 TaxID=3364649 RepID=UPI00369C45DE
MRFRSSLAAAAVAALLPVVPVLPGAPAAADGGRGAGSGDGRDVCAGTGAPGAGGVTACPGDARRASRTRPASTLTAPGAAPACVAARPFDFPIDTRIRKGPATYRPGGGYQEWTVDLTNTTDEPCGALHPLLVLVDEGRTLRPGQVQLEFDDGDRWRPVTFERTAEGEHVGVFDDGFPGFEAGPGRTVGVTVRLAFTSDTAADRVVATAALVQRADDDGDWVGESNDYAFGIEAAGDPRTPTAEQLAATGPGMPLRPGILAGAVLLGGAALLLTARHLRARRR